MNKVEFDVIKWCYYFYEFFELLNCEFKIVEYVVDYFESLGLEV